MTDDTQEPDDLERTDREARAKLDTVTAPKPTVTRIRRKGPKPPATLRPAPIFEVGVHLKNVSIGKGIANTTSTLNFDVDVPNTAWSELMGEHAYAAVFAKGFLGEGFLIKNMSESIDSENRNVQKIQAQLSRLGSNGQYDQIEKCILPLVGDPAQLLGMLSGFDAGWRLNCPVNVPGVLQLFQMQESFDLTTKAPETLPEAKAAE